jgi:hypothetical protein
MRLRISYTVDISDGMRRAIAAHFGEKRRATRAEVHQWYVDHGHSQDDDLMAAADEAHAAMCHLEESGEGE